LRKTLTSVVWTSLLQSYYSSKLCLKIVITSQENRNLFPDDERATKCIINVSLSSLSVFLSVIILVLLQLSNVIQPFLSHLTEQQYKLLNDTFAKAIHHIVRFVISVN
jgi:hypothetical protein